MKSRKQLKAGLLTLSAGCLVLLATGCAERQVEYVPVYQTQPAYTYQSPPPVVPAPDGTVAPPAPAPAPVLVSQAPPPPQVEVVPVAPGPSYVWMPGYWTIGVGGGWVWVGGHYAYPPRPHAVWAGGHWARHGRGYVWVGGRWH